MPDDVSRLTVSAALKYKVLQPSHVLLQIETAKLDDQRVVKEEIDFAGAEVLSNAAGEDDIGRRHWLKATDRLEITYRAEVTISRPDPNIASLSATPPDKLPDETIKYLFDSTYCPATQFQNFVSAEFGDLNGGRRIAAIGDWIRRYIVYAAGYSHARTTALDTFVQRHGVCRDFTHILTTMARASSIPARYASVYGLGVEPQDFHAVADVYLDGAWRLIDPTGMVAANNMARIGVGRDAADVSFMTSFGPVEAQRLEVDVTETKPTSKRKPSATKAKAVSRGAA